MPKTDCTGTIKIFSIGSEMECDAAFTVLSHFGLKQIRCFELPLGSLT